MSEGTALPTVLYVDDEKNNRLIFLYNLKSSVTVRLAESADEALQILSSEPVHILLADLRMPGTNGAELAREVRARYPHLPVFIVTGYPDDEELRDLLASSVVREVFTKPWNPDQLLEAFQNALAPSSAA